MVKVIEYDKDKNEKLLAERGICFDDIIPLLQMGDVIDDISHPDKKKYPKQRIFFIECKGYIYAVPYVDERKRIFLKTIYPSRKAKKKYIGERDEKE